MATPTLFLPLNGSLAGRDSSGSVVTATGIGAAQYTTGQWAGTQAALLPVAATNLVLDPRATNASHAAPARNGVASSVDTGWNAVAGASSYTVNPTGTTGQGPGVMTATGLGTTGQTYTARGVSSGPYFGSASYPVAPTIEFHYTDATVDIVQGPTKNIADQGAPVEFILTATASGSKTLNVIYFYLVTVSALNGSSYQIHLGGAQIEAGSFFTGYIDGTLGTGYSWSGTANNSASTRTVSYLTVPNGVGFSPDQGAIVGWMTPGTFPTGGYQEIAHIGQEGAGADDIRVWLQFNPVTLWAWYESNGSAVYQVGSQAVAAGTPVMWYADWNATTLRVGTNANPLASVAIGSKLGTFGTRATYLGGDGSAQGSVGGSFGPVMGFRQPPTDAERAALFNATAPWTWGMLTPALGGATRSGQPSPLAAARLSGGAPFATSRAPQGAPFAAGRTPAGG